MQDSVKAKIFKRRLSLVEKLPNDDLVSALKTPFLVKGEPLETGDLDLREAPIDQLLSTVERMDTDNFIVRPKRKFVADFGNSFLSAASFSRIFLET